MSPTSNRLAPQAVNRRSLMVNLMVMVCVLVGGVQLMFYGPQWLFWVSMTVLSAVGFIGLGRLLTIPGFATPWAILAVSIALGYGFGTFNTVVRGYTDGIALLEVTYSGLETLSRALGGTLIVVGSLLFMGSVDTIKLIPDKPFTDAERRATFIVLLVTAGAMVVAVATGNLGFQSSQGAEEGSQLVSPLGAVVFSAMSPMMACAVFAFATAKNGRMRTIAFALCLLLMLVLMLQGRRIFMYSMLIAVIAFFGARGAKQFFTVKSLFLLLGVALVVMGTSRFYFAMRMAQWNAGPNPGIIRLAQDGLDIVLNADKEGLDQRISENQGTRTFIIGYLAELIDGVETHRYVGGGLLELDLATAAPTAIWPGKWKILVQGSEEGICHPVVGLPGWDAANSVLTAGMCDFGWAGMMIYPLGLAGMFALLNRAARRLPAVVRMLIAFATFDALFGVENALSAYVVQTRNVLILSVIALVVVQLIRWFDELPSQRRRRELAPRPTSD